MPFLETQYKDEKGCLLPKTDLSFTPGKDKMSSVLGYWWKGKEETCVVGEHRDKGLSVAAAGCAADAWHYTGHAGYSSTLSMQVPA